jgi:Secretion system C-terminal sorting domain
MLNKTIITIIIVLLSFSGFAQQIPLGSCGIVNIYDVAGNRTKRTYFCNNGGTYPSRTGVFSDSVVKAKETISFQYVDALYPNPTTGKFSVSFSKALQNAVVLITDAQGKKVVQFKASGNKIDVDLSAVAPGAYFIRIEEKGTIITKKVVKQ